MSFEDLKKSIDEQATLIKTLRDEHAKELEAVKKSTDLSGEWKQKEDALNKRIDEMEAREKELEAAIKRKAATVLDSKGKEIPAEEVAHKTAVMSYLRKGVEVAADAVPAEYLAGKGMTTLSDPDGGYYVHTDMSGRIVEQIYETSAMRQVASVVTIGTMELSGPVDLGETSGGGWVAETQTRTETGTPQIGMWKIPVHEMYEEPHVTQTLLEDSAFDVESWLSAKVSAKFSRRENSAFVNGDGVGKPRGFLTYTAGTGGTASKQIEQIVTGSASAVTGDGFVNLEGSLKQAYIPGSRFAMKRSTRNAVRLLKDGQNNYLWHRDYSAKHPETLLGYGLELFDDMPAIAAGALVAAFGNFAEAYTIVDRLGISVLRDPFTRKPFIKLYTRKRVGGDVLNFEALKLLKVSM